MITNKTLAILLITALLFSFGGTLLSLNKLGQEKQGQTIKQTTGFASAGGRVNLTITSQAACSVPYNVSFGSGNQPTGKYNLSTEVINNAFSFNADCTDAVTNVCSGILINNTGNVNLNISFYSDVDGSGFLLGPAVAADYQYYVHNGSGTSATSLPGCVQNATIYIGNGTWQNVPTTETYICSNLTYNTTNKQIAIEFNVSIYPATPSGDKVSLLTIGCQQVG